MQPTWLTARIAWFLARRLPPKRPPDFVIGDPADPYMLRWWLIPRNRFLNVYLHRVLRDDDDRALHDHPWASVSLLLDGFLGEVWKTGPDSVEHRYMAAGRVVWRSARFAHRLFLPFRGRPAMTLFITGPVVREWGFWCPQGWRHWRDFTAAGDGGGKGQVGRGCE